MPSTEGLTMLRKFQFNPFLFLVFLLFMLASSHANEVKVGSKSNQPRKLGSEVPRASAPVILPSDMMRNQIRLPSIYNAKERQVLKAKQNEFSLPTQYRRVKSIPLPPPHKT
jgi:hypothetical protein